MSPEYILFLSRRTMETAILLAAPILTVTLVVGFVTAMIQAVTSIRDMTMGMILKLLSVAITVLICGGWMMQTAIGFTKEVFNQLRATGG